ncbi:dTDP-4-dehydrorhamnose reductase [Rhodoluna lacicola]|uniref:dTDP-4-dehydrorhamnose reductase n=1 Tax=Rhodoluna lacicola TaxID=529884 RepID=UPI00222ECED3|nr:dTDP-4-dehydrorhamnose reductase [Rhodoluna lacicola]BDS49763.1 NAD(P)-dependent oxidoreductase [Rhodoluna lacicola]
MRWVVIGDKGLFGSEMTAYLEEKGEVVSRFNRTNFNLDELPESLSRQIGPADVLVNAIGFTAVDQAESELYEANTVNGIYAGKLAEVAAILGAKFFHISTDYVFDGESVTPYGTSAATNPQSVYGKSKELGEQLVAQSGANYTIFRTSWLYGAHGKNFAKTIAKKLTETGSVKVVNDQIGTPTWTRDLAEVVYAHGVNAFNEKIVHAVGSGSGSWFDFAREVAATLPEGEKYFLSPVSTEEFPTAAKRPAFSVLENSDTKGPIIGDWHERWKTAAPEVLAEFLTD